MGGESEPPVDVPTRPGPIRPDPEHLPPGAVTEAAGGRSAAIGGSIDRSVVITGDHNVVHQYFVQHYPSLEDFAIDFDAEKSGWQIASSAGRRFSHGWRISLRRGRAATSGWWLTPAWERRRWPRRQ